MLFVESDGKKELIRVTQTETFQDRVATAKTCSASLHLSIPTLVDKADNAVNSAYAGWPDRMAIVDLDGKISYYGEKGPGGFKPKEVEKWLLEFRGDRSDD